MKVKILLVVVGLILVLSGGAFLFKTGQGVGRSGKMEGPGKGGEEKVKATVYNGVEIVWLGHATFKLKTRNQKPKTIYIDPFQVKKGEVADLILITHDHYDHCDPGSISTLRNSAVEGAVVVTNKACAAKLRAVAEDIRILAAGETLTVRGLEIKAVPAYNIGKEFHPRAAGGLGFIIEVGGVKIYQAGDTDKIPEMSELGPIDVALLPIGGTYTMDEAEAAAAVRLIKPKVAIPMHYGSAVIAAGDPEKFRGLVGEEAEVRVLE